jgi:hypothetical protein
MPRILKGCQKRKSGTLFRVAKTIFGNVPVITLRLPPANFSNSFAVKQTQHYYVHIHNIVNLAIDSTRAHGLALNQKISEVWPSEFPPVPLADQVT